MSDQRLVVVDPQVVLGRARVFHRTHWISIHERLGGGSKYEVVIGIAGGYRSCNQGEREDVIFSTLVHSLGGLKMAPIGSPQHLWDNVDPGRRKAQRDCRRQHIGPAVAVDRECACHRRGCTLARTTTVNKDILLYTCPTLNARELTFSRVMGP